MSVCKIFFKFVFDKKMILAQYYFENLYAMVGKVIYGR